MTSSKMTAIEQESLSLPEKFTNKDIIEKGNDDSVNVVNENSIAKTLDECTGNGNLKSKEHVSFNRENISIENLDNKDNNKEVFKNISAILSSPTTNVPTHSQGSNVNIAILKEEQNNIDLKINLDEGDIGTNTNLKNDVNKLGNRVEKNETNIEIKVDIELKKGSHENEQKIVCEDKENSDNNVDMKICISSTSEGTSVTEETIILNSVMHSKDRIDIEPNVEFDMRVEVCEEKGKINVAKEMDVTSIKENKVEDLHAEILYNENDKILEDSIMDDYEEINIDNIVFKRKKTMDEIMSTVEMKSDIELCEIESTLTSREEVYSELQAISSSEQSPAISMIVQLKDDVMKIEDEAFKENKEDKKIDDVNKENSSNGEISDEIVEVNKKIDEINIDTSDNLNKINETTLEKESEIIQFKKLEIYFEESAMVKLDENHVIKEIKGRELNEMIEDKEIIETDSKASDKSNKINEIAVVEEPKLIHVKNLEINVDESIKLTIDEKIEVNEPDLSQDKEISKINDEMTKMDNIVVEEESQMIQSKKLEINAQKSANVMLNKNMELKEFNEPDYVQVEKVSPANQVVIDVEEQAIEDVAMKEKSSIFMNNEIIDIADEIFDVEEIPENSSDSSNKLASDETDIEKSAFECKETKANKETENRNQNLVGKSGTESEREKITDIEKHVQNVENKKLSHISKLSNTLDILSDEEEDSEKVSSSLEKDCINIEDDDDIVLIDEGTTKNDCKYVENNKNKIKESVEHSNTNIKEEIAMDVCESKTDNIVELGIEDAQVSEKELEEQKPAEKEKPMPKIPILPKTFLKTSKKSLAEMTRDELEEFCIKKIGESVIDRSNLNEIITQLKLVTTNIEDYKKKVNALMKQNRDLQVIVKSVLEEQKNGSNTPITPLKITRSVGLQVFMKEMPIELKKPTASNSFQSLSPNKVRKRQTNQSPKATKSQTNSNQQIPVPRLVPASNNTSSSSNKTAPATPTKIQGGPVPNGVRNSHQIQKPEKRPHSKLQNSVTVDLTDDEPPAKIIQRNVTPPVRLIPQQALLATQRPQFANNSNSPKKVYIPIGSAQNQVRPGHTIMLKQVSQGQRIRTPNIIPKQSVASPLRVTRIAPRHPAPLPDSMKQYQPPNWKALPPTPELKLSKVDNGIVISWKINDYQEDDHEEIASYQLYAYQETSSPPSTALWKKIGDVKALPLPMACTLTQFMSGYKYYFAVRAVDIRSRLGPFSLPGSILLLNKM